MHQIVRFLYTCGVIKWTERCTCVLVKKESLCVRIWQTQAATSTRPRTLHIYYIGIIIIHVCLYIFICSSMKWCRVLITVFRMSLSTSLWPVSYSVKVPVWRLCPHMGSLLCTSAPLSTNLYCTSLQDQKGQTNCLWSPDHAVVSLL